MRPDSGGERRPKFPRSAKLVAGGAAILVVAWLGGWLVDGVLLNGDKAPRGTTLVVPDALTIDGDLTGLSDEDVNERVAGLAVAYSELEVEIGVDTDTVAVPFSSLGLEVDEAATVAAALAVERRGPVGWTQGLFSTAEVRPRFNFDKRAATDTLLSNAPVGDPPIEPRMRLDDDRFAVEPGQPGTAFEIDRALAQLEEKLGKTSLAVAIDAVPLDPVLSNSDIGEFVQIANAITANPVTASLQGQDIEISPQTLRSWIDLETRVGEPSFTIDEVSALKALKFAFPEAGGGGSDATFDVVDNLPIIVDGDPGTTCCAESSPQRILDAIVAGKDRVNLALGEAGVSRNDEWAKSLGIVELIGEFTTNYKPGQSRVVNIARISELTRGVIIEPGETFSVNDFVGRRTRENGFVSAGVIKNGVFENDVGGGISQYATTTFNAAFFAGLDFEQYRSHSIYISRYPYGREATLAFGAIDLAIKNTTPYGVLLWPTTNENSITVQFFSTKFATGEQTGQSKAPLDAACTKVTTQRTRTYIDDREPVIDTVFAIYRPEGIKCNGQPSVPPAETVPPPPPTAPPPTIPPATQPPSSQPPASTPPPTAPPTTPKPTPTTAPPPPTAPPATAPPPTTAAPPTVPTSDPP